MQRSMRSRDAIPDLLTRPPSGSREFVLPWSRFLIDPVKQLEVLAELFKSGLLSREEFEHHKAAVRDL